MMISRSARFGGSLALGAVTAVTVGALLASADPAWAKESRAARVGRIETPLGLQGTRGAGGNIGIIFNLVDSSRRKTDVEVQYGLDVNADGQITDDEYRIATEDRLDTRDTRKNKSPQLFTTAGDIGAAHQYVWKSQADISTDRLLTLEYALTPQGREIVDPDNPDSFLFATGPSGNQVFAGVRVRVRAFRNANDPNTGRKTKVYGDWAVSESFGLNNNNPPLLTIDSVENNGVSVPTASDENVLIHWTAYDPDSEDLNGNGLLDIADGEDINSDGDLDSEKLGVAFDYHRLAPNENPATMTPAQIEALLWAPCTRKAGVGDTDSLDARPGVPLPTTGDLAGVSSAPPGVGRHWTFAWNSIYDVGTVYAQFIFRARPFDQKRETGQYSYFNTPIQVDNWRVFNPGGAPFPIDSLASGRVGHTVTHIRPSQDLNDILDRGDTGGLSGFQGVLVAGGANSINGAGVTALDLMSINTVTAETTTAARVSYALGAARAYHSATQLDDGRILIIGGFNSTGTVPLASTEIYDPKSRTITAGPSLANARAKHAAVKLTSGDVAVFGGVGVAGIALNSCELVHFQPFADSFDQPIAPATWVVDALPAMATAQHSLHAVVLPNQRVLVTGGIGLAGAGVQTAQLLDPLNDNDTATPTTKNPVFLTAPSMIETRKWASATPLLDGNVLFAGGTGSPAKSTMEIYNYQFNAFETVSATMQVARAQHLGVLLGDGTVLLAGGTSDPDLVSPALIGDADVVKLVSRDALSGQWTATLQQVNGDLATARRLAVGTAIDNGRVMLVGGAGATSTLASIETFTPTNGSNRAPKVRVSLPSNEQAYLFGAPIYFRVTDVELDRTRVEVQYIDRTATGDRNWRACSPQTGTIGGDLAETTSDLTTVVTDDTSLAIDPIVHNTTGDHAYIWSMSRDIVRPAPGQSASPYNVRVIPYGAVRGTHSESSPISVLYNTKIVPTTLPFENYADNRPDVLLGAGQRTPNQGGDIRIWAHLRDLDGAGPGTNGNDAQCFFEYAVDRNNDGQIKDVDGEFFLRMSPSGEAVGHAASPNPQVGLKTYYDAPIDSDPAFGQRPAAKGWTFFDWDSVRDIGAPVTTFANVWVRVTPSDDNAGFVRLVRNVTGQPAALTVIRHPDSLFLLSWRPQVSNNKTAMPVNDPIDFIFNGQIEPTTLSNTAVQVFRGTGAATSQVRGQLGLVNNADNTAKVTFYPDPQSLTNGAFVYAQTAASTVLFPNDDYSIRIPGFVAGTNPLGNPPTGPTLRPLGYVNPPTSIFATYRLIQLAPLNTGTTLNDPLYKIRTAGVGVYANTGAAPVLTTTVPSAATVLTRNSSAVAFSFDRAIDTYTATSPNLTVTVPVNTTGGTRTTTSVVPGRWTVTNTPGPNGTSSSSMQFTPLFQFPPGSTGRYAWTTGLKGFDGNSVAALASTWTTEGYTRVSNSTILENFNAQTQNDTAVTTALWGTDGCAVGAVSGASTGLTVPTPPGGSPLSVAANSTVTLTLATNNYSSITVARGGTLVLDSQGGAMTLTATGDITINGTVTFAGKNGVNGQHGYTAYPYMYYGPTSYGTRLGGLGRNGGGNGGNSTSTSNTNYRDAGTSGTGGTLATTSGGQGGQVPSETSSSIYSRYYYGGGGGAGGGNAFAGLAGGRPMTQYTSSAGYGAASTGGSAGGDAFLSAGVNGGGGGGGGASVQYPSYSSRFEGGGGGAGAGSVRFVCDGTFNLSAQGIINGRGGNGGASSHYCGSGGAGAGGGLQILAKVRALLDGVIDLRGGDGGAKGFGQVEQLYISGAATEKTCRYGGDGAPGRLVVLSPNFVSYDEVRVFGQLTVKTLTSLPTTGLTASAPPFGLNGSVTTTSVNFGGTTAVRYSSLTVAAGATVDLYNYTGSTASTSSIAPVQIYVDGAVSISGTLRLNGNSAASAPNHFVQNFFGQRTYPNHGSYVTMGSSGGSLYSPPPDPVTYAQGMFGNMGGGKGGNGFTNGTNAYGIEAGDGSGPAPGVHNMKANSTGYYSNWYFYSGDSGGSGGANATDGDDGWACYAASGAYNYLGATNDTAGTGAVSQSGQTVSTAPKRLGATTTSADPALVAITNLASYVGSGGGGGNGGMDTYSFNQALAGLGGGGAGAVGIVSPVSCTINSGGAIEARGGEGQTSGLANYWGYTSSGYPCDTHAAGGGASGGTVYVASNVIVISPVTPSTGSGGATVDLRGGLGGGRRSQNTVAGLQAYPEYLSSGSFGGTGGYGRLVLAVPSTGTINGVGVSGAQVGKNLANRWGMESTAIDSATNTYKTLAGTARFYCPGLSAGGSIAQSKWYDLRSVSPIVNSFAATTAANATLTTRIEGAQSHPNNPGTGGTGEPDISNTSNQFIPVGASNILSGWRWFRFRLDFTRTTSLQGSAVLIDDMAINYTSDF